MLRCFAVPIRQRVDEIEDRLLGSNDADRFHILNRDRPRPVDIGQQLGNLHAGLARVHANHIL